ncbi:WD40/YVTN/BNR-like repeat-containing protein [Thermasporomyces composti]|uniref:BNR/Asp-box repeat protein n=1 Tax=Thermasporomyces composti TaxID=696763 RepID=A0A3D9V0P0_THECX|nr:sialidase family protein [Thermasporomyces composti]REF35087.1 hypothetical protein DFJ64_0458 [Thermasporomyces composti]
MDPLEERLRQALRDEAWSLPVDPALLSRVRAGAARRRRRRSLALAAAAVTIVATGFGVVGLLLGSEQATVASGAGEAATMMERSAAGDDTSTSTGADPTPLDAGAERAPVPDTPDPSTTRTHRAGPTRAPAEAPVPDGFTPTAVAAASPSTAWVLGTSDGVDGAVVAVSEDGGATFALAGTIGAALARSDGETGPDTVRWLTFAADGRHGWAYGGALWTTQDAGRSWSVTRSVPGTVERVETDGTTAYALVRDGDVWRLWRARVGTVDWRALPVEIHDPRTVTVTDRLLALTDRDDTGAYVLVSTDSGASFTRQETPCSPDLDAGQVTAAGASLWLTCPSGSQQTVHLSTDHGLTWTQVPTGPLPATAAELSARGARDAVVALPGRAMLLDPDGARHASVPGMGEPMMAAFTTEGTGYLLDVEGNLFRTTDEGSTWSRVTVD